MTENQLGHFKHADFLLAAEHFLEQVVWFDEGFVLGVLQIMAANVIPQFARYFRSREGFTADDLGQLVVWFDRLHESRAGLPFAFRCLFRHTGISL